MAGAKGGAMRDRKLAEVFPPGEFIREELEARGWTQDDLAAILGRPSRLVSELITAKRGITPETARGLGGAFGTSAQLWMNLESTYRLWKSDPEQDLVERRARLYTTAPLRLMIKRGWIEDSSSVDVLETRLKDFFGLSDDLREPQFFAHVARRSSSCPQLTPLQNAWLYRAGHMAKAVSAGDFSEARLAEMLQLLKLFLPNPEDLRKIPKLLAEFGIRFIVIEPFPQSKIDGATFWLNNHHPVVVLSLRYDRIDWFWHTLAHELAHVESGDGKNNDKFALDIDLVGERTKSSDNRPQYEVKADERATDFLLPQTELDDFIMRVKSLYSKKKIAEFADRINVHPGIVVGQLQHTGELSYAHNREMLVRIRHIITDVALTDGWGRSVPSSP